MPFPCISYSDWDILQATPSLQVRSHHPQIREGAKCWLNLIRHSLQVQFWLTSTLQQSYKALQSISQIWAAATTSCFLESSLGNKAPASSSGGLIDLCLNSRFSSETLCKFWRHWMIFLLGPKFQVPHLLVPLLPCLYLNPLLKNAKTAKILLVSWFSSA